MMSKHNRSNIQRDNNINTNMFTRLNNKKSESLLKKHLSRELYEELDKLRTENKVTIDDVIRSGVENPSSMVGIYAPDYQSYEMFDKLFDLVIADYHGVDVNNLKNPESDFGKVESLPNIDPEGRYVVSTRTRLARNIAEFPFNPKMSRENYLGIERIAREATRCFKGDLVGQYKSLASMSEQHKDQLIEDHLLYKEKDKYLEQAQALNFWPAGRGIYMNNDKTFMVWVGEEDHIRLISMQKGGDLGQVVARLKNAAEEFSQHFQFAHNGKYGFLTFCPTNLGTTIRSSVHIRLPLLSKDLSKFEKIAMKNRLQIRGVNGEHSESKDGVYDVSNRRRFGATEHDVIMDMYRGCCELIRLEKELEKQSEK